VGVGVDEVPVVARPRPWEGLEATASSSQAITEALLPSAAKEVGAATVDPPAREVAVALLPSARMRAVWERGFPGSVRGTGSWSASTVPVERAVATVAGDEAMRRGAR